MSNKKQELEKIITEARSELWEIENTERQKLYTPLVGKFFKYRNSYSVPQTEADYWYQYVEVTGVEGENIGVKVFMFENDVHGQIRIELDGRKPILSSGYTEISRDEFLSAWQNIQDSISTKSV